MNYTTSEVFVKVVQQIQQSAGDLAPLETSLGYPASGGMCCIEESAFPGFATVRRLLVGGYWGIARRAFGDDLLGLRPTGSRTGATHEIASSELRSTQTHCLLDPVDRPLGTRSDQLVLVFQRRGQGAD